MLSLDNHRFFRNPADMFDGNQCLEENTRTRISNQPCNTESGMAGEWNPEEATPGAGFIAPGTVMFAGVGSSASPAFGQRREMR